MDTNFEREIRERAAAAARHYAAQADRGVSRREWFENERAKDDINAWRKKKRTRVSLKMKEQRLPPRGGRR